MNRIVRKFIETTDRIALIGIPDEKRRPEYRRRRENFAKRDAITEEATLPATTGIPAAKASPAEQPVEPLRRNKPIDLLTARPVDEIATEPVRAIPPSAPVTALTPPAPAAAIPSAAVTTANKRDARGMDLGNIANMFEEVETEEESPLKRLAATLPDVTAAELLIDIKEAEGIIRAYVKTC